MTGPLLSLWLGAPLARPALPIDLPTERLADVGWLDVLLAYAPFKALLPIPVIAAMAPLVVWFFGKTWRSLDSEAQAAREAARLPVLTNSTEPQALLTSNRRTGVRLSATRRGERDPWRPTSARTRRSLTRRERPAETEAPGSPTSKAASSPLRVPFDYRPAACLVIVAIVLTLQEYYGGRSFYGELIRPWLEGIEAGGGRWVKLQKYDELWSFGWWSFSRFAGYVLFPLPLWKLLFPRDSLLDMGLRVKGLTAHVWLYLLCLGVVIPTMLIVANQPDFGNYYPFYKSSSRSWFDLLAWECMYFAQFFALELFFRGFILGALRKPLGSAAIFAMAVPYCMIHYGKPYLETNGAIIAGIVLGSLAMHTRSIYSGFLVHITVAFLMDFLSLWKRGGLPTQWFAP